MSYILRATVVGVSAAALRSALHDNNLEIIGLTPTLSLAAERDRGAGPDRVTALAGALSKAFGSALAVNWDDRTGKRSAGVFENGQLVASYDERDERWAEVGESGSIDEGGGTYTFEEARGIDEDIELAVVRNAVEMACDRTSHIPWAPIKDFIARGG